MLRVSDILALVALGLSVAALAGASAIGLDSSDLLALAGMLLSVAVLVLPRER